MTINTEKPKLFDRIETPTNINWNNTHPKTREETYKDTIRKINIEIMKRIMSEKKTTLPSLSNQDWKTVKVETDNINNLLTYLNG